MIRARGGKLALRRVAVAHANAVHAAGLRPGDVILRVSDEDGLFLIRAKGVHRARQNCRLGVVVAVAVAAGDDLEQLQHPLALQQFLGEVLRLRGCDTDMQPRTDKRVEQLLYPGEHPAFIQADRLIALSEILRGGFGLLLRKIEFFHEHIHQRRTRKAAQRVELRLDPALCEGVLDGLGYSLDRVKNGPVEIKQDIFVHEVPPLFD